MNHPFMFKDRCPNCLSKDISYIDLQDTEHKSLLFVTKSVKCNNCEQEFFIKWEKDNNESEAESFIADKDITDGFVKEICDFGIKSRRQLI